MISYFSGVSNSSDDLLLFVGVSSLVSLKGLSECILLPRTMPSTDLDDGEAYKVAEVSLGEAMAVG